MATVEIDKQNFEATVVKGGIVLLDFWAEWCGPCRSFAPVFEQASGKHADITFGKIDTDAQPELAGFFEIRSIPSLVIFRDGIRLGPPLPGALPPAALEDLISQVRALDMDDVRKQVAAQREASEPQKA